MKVRDKLQKGVPQGEGRRSGTEAVFEELIADNFQKFIKDIKP